MRGPRLFDHTDWKSKKRSGYSSSDVLFSLKRSVENKKRSSLFVMRALTFSEALGFSLLNLLVNSALLGVYLEVEVSRID